MSKLIETIILLSEFTEKSIDRNCTVHQNNTVLTKSCVAKDDTNRYIHYIRCELCPFFNPNLNLSNQTLKENIQNV